MAQTRLSLENFSLGAALNPGNGSNSFDHEPDSRSLDYYLKETRNSLILPEDRVIEAWQRARRGDAKAKDRLVRSNLRLVISIALYYRHQGLDLADLIGEGNRGLLRAVKNFQADKGSKFSTYATKWIKQSITKALSDQSRQIRIPVHQVDQRRLISKTDDFLARELEKEPTLEEIARKLRLSQEKVEFSVMAPHATVSLDAPAGEDERGNIGEVIEDPEADQPDVSALTSLQTIFCYRAVRRILKPREQLVIILYYGLGGRTPLTLEEVGKEMGITRERVRQIMAKAVPKLTRYYQRHGLRLFQKGIS